MKLLTSPSFSSSATAISSQSNVCTARRATIGCLAGVLRRMLCTRSLPTYPADHTRGEPYYYYSADGGTGCQAIDPVDRDSSPTPGLVARLMGLESLPGMNPVKVKASPSVSISRSRSMSSVDYRAEECDPEGNRHRRIKASMSFREAPTYLELEDGEFLVLSFEGGSESKELWSTQSQRKFKKGKMEKCRTDEHGAAKKDPCSRPRNATDVSEEVDGFDNIDLVKSRRKTKQCRRKDLRIKKVEAEECSSEEASPVSVLDFGEWITGPEEAATASDDSTTDSSNLSSRRRLSPELEHAEHSESGAHGDSELLGQPERPADGENSPGHGSWRKDYHPEMWRKIRKIAHAQIMESNWVYRRNWMQLEESEAIGIDLERQVLDQLLDELLEELVPVQRWNITTCNTLSFSSKYTLNIDVNKDM